MIHRQLQRAQRWLAVLLCAVIVSCTKDASLAVTQPPVIDSLATVKYTGGFVNGSYGTVTGAVQILKQDTNDGLSLKNFSGSSAPDLHVYLSKEQKPATLLTPAACATAGATRLTAFPAIRPSPNTSALLR